jgi:NodT family efflux transporter outer membrane factor (OMF) lipoprotein
MGKNSIFLTGLIWCFASGCAVGPDFSEPPKPAVSAFTNQTIPTLVATDQDLPADWWRLFKSEGLDRTVERALKSNPQIDMAKAVLRQSQENLAAVRAGLFPILSSDFSGTRAKYPSSLSNPTNNPSSTYSVYTAQLSISYVPDVFGGLRRQIESADAQAENQHFQFEAVQTTLATNVVIAVVQEAALRKAVDAAARGAEIQNKLTKVARKQKQLGQISQADLAAQEQAEGQSITALAAIRRQYDQQHDALAVLTGGFPSEDIKAVSDFDDLQIVQPIPMSLPSKLVSQRPDVRAALENMRAANAEIGVAIASMFPQFGITGNYGSASNKIVDLFSPSFGFAQLTGGIAQTLFDGGALIHRRRAADAALDQALANYQMTVLTAFQNVADALAALNSDDIAVSGTAITAKAAHRSFELAQKQYASGNAPQAFALAAEFNDLNAQMALVQAKANRLADTAGLFQALGGGWWNRRHETAGN